jgi:ATP-dependent DNA helicase DinG
VDDCPLIKARRRAQQADLVVINHHLFFADLAVRESGFGEVVPFAEVLLFDEAHLIPDVATQFFGEQVSSNQLINLSRDLQAENPGDIDDLEPRLRRVETATGELTRELGQVNSRDDWAALIRKPALKDALAELIDALTSLLECLAPHQQRSKELDNCGNRAERMIATLRAMQLTPHNSAEESESPEPNPDDEENTRPNDGGTVQWLEQRGRGFVLHNDPIEIAPRMEQAYEAHPRSWIFTSTTLAAGDTFDLFTRRMGLLDSETLLLDTPFDYANQALLYLPPDLPEPNDERHTEAVVAAALPVLRASKGRAFLLFTSYAALHRAKDLLSGETDFSLLIQGDLPKAKLLEKFQQLPNAVLLATASFWQGVDVRGDALSCVIIDKLPFASPFEPLIKARIDSLRRAGGNPFRDLQMPSAIITLKQGAGRLIRDHGDRGLLMICDPRLRSRSYGKTFVAALPPMRTTEKVATATAFFTQAEEHTR